MAVRASASEEVRPSLLHLSLTKTSSTGMFEGRSNQKKKES
jgi:hypothetical protein